MFVSPRGLLFSGCWSLERIWNCLTNAVPNPAEHAVYGMKDTFDWEGERV